jgi:hypothetical protein
MRLLLFAVAGLALLLGCASGRRSRSEMVWRRARADTVEAIVAAVQAIRDEAILRDREVGILVYTDMLRPLANAVGERLQLPVFGKSERVASRPHALQFGAPRPGSDGALIVPVGAVQLKPYYRGWYFDCTLSRHRHGWRVESCTGTSVEIS